MPFDGIFMANICRELNAAVGARIEKIYQPSREELVLLLGGKNFNQKLYLSAGGAAPRVHFTNLSFENPLNPPMFCMLMRKHFTNAKLNYAVQHGLDRILTLGFSSFNEMGDSVSLEIAVEIMGRQSNVIMICDGKIIDALKRSDPEMGKRLILPGAKYEYPESQGKIDLRSVFSTQSVAEKAEAAKGGYASVLEGVSPLISREIEHLKSIIGVDGAIDAVKNGISDGRPYMIYKDGKPVDFTYMPIGQYGASCESRKVDSFGELLDGFFEKRQKEDDIRRRTHDVNKIVTVLTERTARKLEKQRGELSRCTDAENLRIFGELIKTNIHLIERGATLAELPNYYDPECKPVRVPLNPELSPSQNAQKYFKEYRKSITAGEMLEKLIKSGEDELEYLLSVSEELKRAESEKELNEIKLELESAGYIKIKKQSKKPPKALPPLVFKTDDGFTVRVGRNNRQNDELTLKSSAKHDIWLHTKAVHGAHVVISSEGKSISDSAVCQAAVLAAYHSDAKNSSSVAVDYCYIKNVHKPAGAKPGMVIYDDYRTVYVTPDDETVEKMRSNVK